MSDMLKESEIRGYRDALKTLLGRDCICPNCAIDDALNGNVRATTRVVIEALSWVLGEKQDMSGKVETASKLAHEKRAKQTGGAEPLPGANRGFDLGGEGG